MYVPIGENTFVSHVVWRMQGLEALNKSALSRAYFKAGAMPASSRDFWPGGVLKYRNLAKGVRPSLGAYVLRVRGFYAAPPRLIFFILVEQFTVKTLTKENSTRRKQRKQMKTWK